MIARPLFSPETETFLDSARRFMDTEVQPNDCTCQNRANAFADGRSEPALQ